MCSKILDLFRLPAFHQSSLVELGTVAEVITEECAAHARIFNRNALIGYPGHHQHPESIQLSLLKKPGGTSIQIFTDSTIWQPFELVKCASRPNHTGRGRVLDSNWIDPNLIKSWKERCDKDHGEHCWDPASIDGSRLSQYPIWLVDTWRRCLVPANSGRRYVALSYVWGQKKCLMTMSTNIEQLQLDNALNSERFCSDIPETIKNAMRVVDIILERYLWVDSLCIVQDDHSTRQTQLNNMSAIFAKACVTIIAAQGSNAEYGLRGFREFSRPRELDQEVWALTKGEKLIERQFSDPDTLEKDSPWYKRSWTFQEHLNSRRRLFFEADTVRWECDHAVWYEDVHETESSPSHVPLKAQWTYITRYQFKVAVPFPNLRGYGELVSVYNHKDLSHPEDATAAFAGVTTQLSRTYSSGFNCGLPEMFFDVALLWQPWRTVKRRISTGTRSTNSCLPSWSWAGWQGEVDPWTWESGCDYIKDIKLDVACQTSRRTISVVQWYSSDRTCSERRVISSNWMTFKACPRSLKELLKDGWSRHEYQTSKHRDLEDGLAQGSHFYYTHQSFPSHHFWYPIPLRDPRAEPIIRHPAPLLFTHTCRAWFRIGSRISGSWLVCVPIRDTNGAWVGILRMPNEETLTSIRPEKVGTNVESPPLEFIALSRGYADGSRKEEPGLDEWLLEERPTTTALYEFYNVMWIEWENGIAYRRALGRILRDVWESQKLEWVDITLG